MIQKLIVGVLILTVIGAVGVGIYDSARDGGDEGGIQVLAKPASDQPVGQAADTAETQPDAAPGQPDVTATPAIVAGEMVQQMAAVDMVGDPWAGTGTITALDDAGMTLALEDGRSIYVELGPPYYWQAQAVTLVLGDKVAVTGFFNGEQYHAATVTVADGAQMALRTLDGQPLWSGGAGTQASTTSDQGQHGAQGDAGGAQQQPLVAPEDWLTLEATVTAVGSSLLTVQTAAGDTLDLQLGQPRFVSDQAIAFAVGDEVRVLGFWQGTMFKAGEITRLATGERLMLLDPNGRPLWGGPGRSGQSGQSGQGGQGQTQDGTGSTGQGQGQSQGGGNGYPGGRNNAAAGSTTLDSTVTTSAAQGQGGGNGYRGGR